MALPAINPTQHKSSLTSDSLLQQNLSDLKTHNLTMVSFAASACAVLWGPGGDAHSLPASPA